MQGQLSLDGRALQYLSYWASSPVWGRTSSSRASVDRGAGLGVESDFNMRGPSWPPEVTGLGYQH